MSNNRPVAGRGITRRTFAMGLGAVASYALLNSPRTARAAEPKQGGRLRIGIARGDTSDNLDPSILNNTHPINITWQLRNNLVEIGASSEAVPELAESWEPSKDAKIWRFKLRKGVTFHNGKAFDAEDAAYSINYHIRPDSKSGAAGFLADVESVKADGSDTLVITLKNGNADLPYMLGDYHLQMVPAGTTNFSDGMGTGGYTLVEYEPGVRALVKRNPNYWKAGRAHADEIETLVIADDNARTTALRTNQIDVMNAVDLKTIGLLKRVAEVKILEMTGKKHYTLPMLTNHAPYDNPDVRMALKLAINRQELLDKVLAGHGALGNDQPIASSNRFVAHLPQREYDPDQARSLMKKAGMENTVFQLHAADAAFAGAVDTATLFQAHAAAAGIKIDIVREPNDGYWSNVWRKKDFAMAYWSGRPTEDWMFSSAYQTGASWNDSNWSNPRFDEVIKLARAELDDSKRADLYKEAQLLVRDQGGVIIPMFANDVIAHRQNVMYDKPSAAWELDGLRCGERWWLA
ncbi:ABC transporter substrate-binding protein [Mesorhizobium sp. CA8]|uniref:ABC transporter substrate-binding protein n=1 Tax=unclassified Mesorhizobium TaxID=325217 RepID=UPI001CCF3B43|nr:MULTISPECIES: ABC transporter substrate-binding protein [unclassified Mesorhizobium]MBZ9761666.1 ABC transporter substrate-binding protein [Mesorhizobium sp. CA8]MBZ9820580.1 ABC transporter substrate-binding protein [Mesorhizobium sp. CA4]